MANLIDTTFFYPPMLEIPQVNTESVAASVRRYIEVYEPEYLGLLLGATLATALVAPAPLTEAATAIISGAAYTDGFGDAQAWPGLVTTYGNTKRSPIANYVYCKYMQEQVASVTTGTGEKTPKAQNAADSTPKYKVQRAWNEMVHANWNLMRFITARTDLFPGYVRPALTAHTRRLFSPVNMYM